MAKKIELAKAYVQVIPTTDNIGENLRDLFDAPSTQAGEEAGDNVGKGITGGLSKLIGKAALVAVVAKIGKKIGETITESINQYADYEQLVGGVETLFKDSADIVTQYAQNAYKTAGLSANEYMETVTSFSASLLQSLDGDTTKAAQVADQAITDMSDNANKLGTSMEMIQNAYQGFAKNNYTMLDNLKLGYGGTKQEMERLLEDAEKLSGVEYDISSYADIVEAIHVVQTEMGITGTTAEEASTTITGSLNAVKSSWTNLLTAMADPNADMSEALSNFGESAKTYAANLMPTLLQALRGSVDLVGGLVDIVIEFLPQFTSEVLPELVTGIVDLLVNLIDKILEAMPTLIESLATGLLSSENISSIIRGAMRLTSSIVEHLPEIILALIEAIPTVIESILEAVTDPENIRLWIEGFTNLVVTIVTKLPEIIFALIEAIPTVVVSIVKAFVNPENLKLFLGAGKEAVKKIKEAFAGLPDALKEKFVSAKNKFIEAWSDIKQICGPIVNKIRDKFGELKDKLKQIGKDIVSGLWNGINSKVDWIKKKISGWCNKIGNAIKDFFGIASPSKLMAEYGRYIDEGLAEGITKNADITKSAMRTLGESALNGINVEGIATANVNLATTRPIGEAMRLDRIEELLSEIAKGSDVYLDGSKLVGATANKMEKALNTINYNRERGVVYGY